MRLLVGSVVALLFAGCGEARLSVAIVVPDLYGPALEQLTLRVVEPGDAAFGCDDIAYGRVDSDTVAARVVRELTVRRDEDGLPGFDVGRSGIKLIWTAGYDAEGRELLVGCEATSEDIDTSVEVTVTLEPSATLTVPDSFELFDFEISGELPYEIPATLTDLLGSPLAFYDVEWELLGPGNVDAGGFVTTGADGIAFVRPQATLPPGPWAIDFRGRWLNRRPDPIFGLTNGRGFVQSFNTYPRVHEVGRVVQLGERRVPGVVTLTHELDAAGALLAYHLFVTWYDPISETLATAGESLAPNEIWGIGLGRFVTSSDLEQIIFLRNFGVLDKRWVSVSVVGGAVVLSELGPSADLPSDLVFFGGGVDVRPCAGESGVPNAAFLAMLVAVDLTVSLRVYDSSGGYLGSTRWDEIPSDSILFGSSCLGSGQQRRAVVRVPNGQDPEVFTISDDGSELLEHKLGNLVGLAEPFDPVGDWPGRVAGVRISGTDAALGFFELEAGVDPTLRLVEEDAVFAGTLGQRAGDLDGDGRADVVSMFPSGQQPGPAGGTSLRMFLRSGRVLGDTTVRAISSEFELIGPRHFLADLDDDGKDDIIVTQRRSNVNDGSLPLPPDLVVALMGAP